MNRVSVFLENFPTLFKPPSSRCVRRDAHSAEGTGALRATGSGTMPHRCSHHAAQVSDATTSAGLQGLSQDRKPGPAAEALHTRTGFILPCSVCQPSFLTTHCTVQARHAAGLIRSCQRKHSRAAGAQQSRASNGAQKRSATNSAGESAQATLQIHRSQSFDTHQPAGDKFRDLRITRFWVLVVFSHETVRADTHFEKPKLSPHNFFTKPIITQTTETET